ncbi:MAG: hypothetical protein JXR94_17435 [Candidatus Hydrogenedentes bacterium]|nr:hypothetical protein [Candidatus Hydrogenedentota bacterium]
MFRRAPSHGARRRFSILWIAVLVLLIAAYLTYRFWIHSQIQQEMAAIHEAGHPATLEELDAWYEEPPLGENAADVFAVAFEYYRYANDDDEVPFVGKRQRPPDGKPLPDAARERSVQYLADNAQALKYLHEASKIDKCRWPIDLTRGPNTELPHLARVRQGARLVALEALVRADAGDADGAIESVEAVSGVARSLAREPNLISQLVHAACLEIAVKATEQVLDCAPALSDEQLARLDALLVQPEDSFSLAVGLVGERCMLAEVLRTDAVSYVNGEPALGAVGVLRRFVFGPLGLRDLEVLYVLRSCREPVRLAQGPLSGRLGGDSLDLVEIPSILVFVAGSVAHLPRAFDRESETIARFRTARAAVAIERYTLSHGARPASLAELPPEFVSAPLDDPFASGAPLQFGPPDPASGLPSDAYIVYSVGLNRRDEGGIGLDKDGDLVEVDIPFIVVHPLR